jgi:DNA-binding transcriptional MerR regulator
MQLKNSYSAREVASITGLSARQLQWWDERRLFQPAVAPRPTAAGGFTERRYTPVDLLELMVLADLRRQGMTVSRLRLLLETLRSRFGVRLFDTIGGTGALTLLTDGRDVYARTTRGQFYNLLRDPEQPLLVIEAEPGWRELAAKTQAARGRRKTKEKKKTREKKGKTARKKTSDADSG